MTTTTTQLNELGPRRRVTTIRSPIDPTPRQTEKVRKTLAAAYDSSVRTVSSHDIFGDEPELIGELKRYADLTAREWAGEVNRSIIESVRFIARAAKSGNPRSPRMVLAIAQALKTINEADLTRRVIDAKLAQFHQPLGREVDLISTTRVTYLGEGAIPLEVTAVFRPTEDTDAQGIYQGAEA